MRATAIRASYSDRCSGFWSFGVFRIASQRSNEPDGLQELPGPCERCCCIQAKDYLGISTLERDKVVRRM